MLCRRVSSIGQVDQLMHMVLGSIGCLNINKQPNQHKYNKHQMNQKTYLYLASVLSTNLQITYLVQKRECLTVVLQNTIGYISLENQTFTRNSMWLLGKRILAKYFVGFLKGKQGWLGRQSKGQEMKRNRLSKEN